MTTSTVYKRRLTQQQRRVLYHLSHGFSHQQIADAMGISPSTVRAHLTAAYRTLGVTRSEHAIRKCFERGILTTGEESAA